MPEIERRLHCFADSEIFARRLSRHAGIGCARVRVHRFPDGESLVRVRSPVGSDALLVRSLHDPNAKLIEIALAADALRRAGAKRITLIAPYLPYMRQVLNKSKHSDYRRWIHSSLRTLVIETDIPSGHWCA